MQWVDLKSSRLMRERARGHVSNSDPNEILSDLEFARRVSQWCRFGVVDVTSKPIEESADEVVTLVSQRAK
jgi:hypothetical protein